MDVYIGSARIDENGKISCGKAGDQKQTTVNDYSGEVSMQKFYVHKKGWIIVRPKDLDVAIEIASNMTNACNNKNIGYDQNERLGVIKNGINSPIPTECDCSSLVRACVKEATGKDPGNFTTANAVTMLESTGLFYAPIDFISLEKTPIYKGDILCTKTKGHIVVVVSASIIRECDKTPDTSNNVQYYPACSQYQTTLSAALSSVGEKDTSKAHRKLIAKANGISNYNYTAEQNTQLLKLLKAGKLIKA